MHGDSLIVILIVGIVAGWLAGQITRGTGFGLVADLIIGIVGAWIGFWLLHKLGVYEFTGTSIIDQIITATIGAVVLLFILGLFRRRRRW